MGIEYWGLVVTLIGAGVMILAPSNQIIGWIFLVSGAALGIGGAVYRNWPIGKKWAVDDPDRPIGDYTGLEGYIAGRKAFSPTEISRNDEKHLKDAFLEAKRAANNVRKSVEDKVKAIAEGNVVHKAPFFYNSWELDKPLCPRCYQLDVPKKVYLIHSPIPPESFDCPAKDCGFSHYPNGNVHVSPGSY